MKKNYLLPHYFKKIGLVMLPPFLAACIWLLSGPCEGDWLEIRVPALLTIDLDSTWFGMATTDPVNEICMLGLLFSLVFIALAKEKDEDEMTAVVRMQSFVWSFWYTAIIEMLAIIFIYDFAFLYFTFASVFICFLLFICKFNYEMLKIRRM